MKRPIKGMDAGERARMIDDIVRDYVHDKAKCREMITFLLEVTGVAVDFGCPPNDSIPNFLRQQCGQAVVLAEALEEATGITEADRAQLAAFGGQIGDKLKPAIELASAATVAVHLEATLLEAATALERDVLTQDLAAQLRDIVDAAKAGRSVRGTIQ